MSAVTTAVTHKSKFPIRWKHAKELVGTTRRVWIKIETWNNRHATGKSEVTEFEAAVIEVDGKKALFEGGGNKILIPKEGCRWDGKSTRITRAAETETETGKGLEKVTVVKILTAEEAELETKEEAALRPNPPPAAPARPRGTWWGSVAMRDNLANIMTNGYGRRLTALIVGRAENANQHTTDTIVIDCENGEKIRVFGLNPQNLIPDSRNADIRHIVVTDDLNGAAGGCGSSRLVTIQAYADVIKVLRPLGYSVIHRIADIQAAPAGFGAP